MLPGSSQSRPTAGITSDDLDYEILATDVIVNSVIKEIKSINAKANNKNLKAPKKHETRSVLKSVIEFRKRQTNATTNFPI